MRPNPTDVSCLRCGDAVPLQAAITTLGYCARCAPNNVTLPAAVAQQSNVRILAA